MQLVCVWLWDWHNDKLRQPYAYDYIIQVKVELHPQVLPSGVIPVSGWEIPKLHGHLNGELIELGGCPYKYLITRGYSTKNVAIVTIRIGKTHKLALFHGSTKIS